MAFIDCITRKISQGLLSAREVEILQNKFDNLYERYQSTMSDADAAAQAAADIINVEAMRLKQRKANEAKAALMQEDIVRGLEEREAAGRRFDKGVRDLLEKAYVRRQSVMKQYLSSLDEFVDEYRSKFAGLYRRTDGMKQVVSELLGKNTGSQDASEFATALRKVFDYAHARYRASGGIIGKLNNYFPQVHNFDLVKNASFDEWYNFIRPRLDTDRMIDFDTGLPFSEEKLTALMRDDYEGIVTRGKSELRKRAEEGKQTFGLGAEVSNRKDSGRFYHFRDADSFLEYNEVYGVGEDGLFDAVVNHLEGFARDTGMLETLGPKPNALMRHLTLQMEGRMSQNKFSKFFGIEKGITNQSVKWVNGMYDILSGFANQSVGNPWWNAATGNARNVMSAAYLGSAPFSAIADAAFIGAAASLNNLSVTRTMGRYLKLMSPLSSKDRRLAKRSGYIADIARGQALADVRFTGENMGGKATAWLAQFTNRASLLHTMTKSASDAIALELEATLAELVTDGVRWGRLDSGFRDNLIAHGITRNDWNLLSRVRIFEAEDGVQFLRSQEMAELLDISAKDAIALASKFDDLIHTMRNLATNEPTLRTQAITTGAFAGDARRGTALRAFSASMFHFKSFPITVLFNHIIPSIKAIAPAFSGDFKSAKYKHAAWTAVGTTILGTFGLQMSQLVLGKDPRDFEDWRTWGAGALKGGGLGIFGDFLFSSTSGYDRGLETEVSGTTVGLASDVFKILVGAPDKLLDDPSAKNYDRVKRDIFKLVSRNTPAVNLWYSRLAVERLFLDQIERMLDPQFDKRTNAMERKMMRETGQQYYWRRGDTAPLRAPRIAEKPTQ